MNAALDRPQSIRLSHRRLHRKQLDASGNAPWSRGLTAIASTHLAITLLAASLPSQEASPTARIDGTSELLGWIQSIQPTPDLGVSVAEIGEPTIRVYSPTGKLRKVVGRRGAGPGEFRLVTRHGWVNSNLWVADNQLKRTTFFSRSLDLARMVRWPATSRNQSGAELTYLTPPQPQAYLTDGTMIVSVSFRGETSEQIGFPPGTRTALLHADTSGVLLSLVAGVETTKAPTCRVPWQSGSKLRGLIPIPYCQRPLFAISPSGEYVAVADPGDSPEAGFVTVTLVRASGRVVRRGTVTTAPTPIPEALVDVAKARLRKSLAPSASPEERAATERIAVPKHFPLISDLQVADDGSVLLERWQETGGHSWHTLDETLTRMSAALPWPTDVDLVAVVDERAWIATRDGDDVFSIASYPGPGRRGHE